MTSEEMTSKYCSDQQIIELARKISAKYGDSEKRTFDIPLYQSCIRACLNETCHQMGLRVADTEEFRKLLIENLKKL
jgi:hypothetical protein